MENSDVRTIIIVFVILNVLAFLIMHYDKNNARRGKKRVSEASLLTLAAIGGSVGILVSMYVYHHKTKKKRFKFGIPLIIILQIILIIMLSPNQTQA